MVHLLYGYIPDEQWLLDIAREHDLGKFSDDPEDAWHRAEAKKNALHYVIHQARMGLYAKFRFVRYKHEDRMIIALATTEEHARWLRPTVDGVKRLQEILGVTERPKWYKMCSD